MSECVRVLCFQRRTGRRDANFATLETALRRRKQRPAVTSEAIDSITIYLSPLVRFTGQLVPGSTFRRQVDADPVHAPTRHPGVEPLVDHDLSLAVGRFFCLASSKLPPPPWESVPDCSQFPRVEDVSATMRGLQQSWSSKLRSAKRSQLKKGHLGMFLPH